MSQNGQEWRTL